MFSILNRCVLSLYDYAHSHPTSQYSNKLNEARLEVLREQDEHLKVHMKVVVIMINSLRL